MTTRCPKCGNNTLRKGSVTAAGKQRYTCRGSTGDRKHCYETVNPDAPYRNQASRSKAPDKQPEFKQKLRGQRFVITWAQNATPVHADFLACLLTYCKVNDAQLVVIPGRYKNPTSTWTGSQENEERWAPELAPYLFNQRKALNKNIQLIGDIKIQPTMSQPLTALDGLTHGESAIFGHPKLQLRVVPTPQNRLPKILTTTGAVTMPNYTDTRVGKLGAFHHVLGAALVEIQDSKVFHLRQINYSEKHHGFIDLNVTYRALGASPADPYWAIVFGDAHWRFADPVVVAATFEQLVPRLNPHALVWHDLLDGYAVTPHHVGNPFIAYAKQMSGYNDMRAEVHQTIDWMHRLGAGRLNIIVPSNHDDMLKRWIIRADWKEDPVNAEFYLETALDMLRSTRMGERGAETLDPFQRIVAKRSDHKTLCVPVNGSKMIAGIECALHGDKGPNGARGSIKNLKRIGPKVIIGHSHTPGIDEGAYQTGTMTRLSAEYTGPVGSWLNTHCSIDAFGKRHLHNCIDGRFWL